MGDEIGKFLQAELQPTLQDNERQLIPMQAESERTQTLMAKVLEAMTGVLTIEINFWTTNILDEQNGEIRRREIQRPSLLQITSITVPDEVLDSKRSRIDKIFGDRASAGQDDPYLKRGRKNAHCKCEKLKRDKRKQFQFGCEFNQLTLEQRNRVTHVRSTSNYKERRSEQRRDRNYEFSLGPRGQPPPGQGPTGQYIPRNTQIPEATIFAPPLNTEQEIPDIPNVMTKETIKGHMRRWMLKGYDLIPIGKDDDVQYWPGFGPDVSLAKDWKQIQAIRFYTNDG
ncbi:MAG: hypothetical protein EZS28_022978 [Streblomastix strix]|uniref:Uncharacterized protein n=1 Tax=Streblomastix strix TaxID=222440 RepID=A0A5J4VGA0_9EUKA|nr:MAG: hypothetical protein EZS28_022978 [Streblomastix strix]